MKLEQPPRSSTVDAVRAHLLQSLRRPPSPRSVARALGLSARTLQRRLAARGTTFRRVLTALRIDMARTMLRNAEASVAEIAEAVGFERVSSLSRAFAACTGEPPLAYRKRVRAAAPGGLPAG